MILEPTITYGTILETTIALIGGVGFLFALRGTIDAIRIRIEQMGGRLIKLEDEITKLSEVVISNARIEERVINIRADLVALALRTTALEKSRLNERPTEKYQDG